MTGIYDAAAELSVVASEQNRYSLWPSGRALPKGWRNVGATGSKATCEAWLDTNDTLRRRAASVAEVKMSSAPAPVAPVSAKSNAPAMKFGLMFFGDDEQPSPGGRYDMLMNCARFADQHGFASIWLPERHFTKFGCLYPSPAVLHAAIARETKQIRLRAGSVVMPLHHPIRVAEEWSMVDNLSNGRVDLSFASGWHPQDFALRPEAYQDRHARMMEGIEQVRNLWRGETIAVTDGKGAPVNVRVYPTPVQQELPIYLTAASNPATFEAAGRIGANIVTHLFDQQVETLAGKIRIYRESRAKAGYDASTGQVCVALHTFVAATLDDVRRHAREAYCNYLRSNIGLLGSLALSRGVEADITKLSKQDMDELLGWLFEKFLGGRSLLGTPETCQSTVEELQKSGVNEIACLLDFGPTAESIAQSLPRLAELCAAAKR